MWYPQIIIIKVTIFWDVTLGSLIDMYQYFRETTASINIVDNGGSRQIAKMCITPYSHRILVAMFWKTVTL
jgi:uncharacterized membrane protein